MWESFSPQSMKNSHWIALSLPLSLCAWLRVWPEWWSLDEIVKLKKKKKKIIQRLHRNLYFGTANTTVLGLGRPKYGKEKTQSLSKILHVGKSRLLCSLKTFWESGWVWC